MHTKLHFCLSKLLCILFAALLAGCGGKEDEDQDQPQAELAQIGDVRHTAGATPFVANVGFSLRNYADLASIAYTIAPRSGSYSKPLAVTYEKTWLDRRNAHGAAGRVEMPVFGLYAGYLNSVALTASFRDGSRHEFRASVASPGYSGPAQLYAAPSIRTARGPERVPGFDFMMIKNGLSSPVVVDTDGHMRWTGAVLPDSFSSLFNDGMFYIGSQTERVLHRMDVGGAFTSVPVGALKYTNFHHDLAPGKTGILAEFDAIDGGVARIESILSEIDPNGNVLKEWDLGRIFSEHMRARGDNPANFVREGADWFHMNSAIYHAADNSLLISSRENFVVKLDYDSGATRWLFGDTSKRWYVNYRSSKLTQS